MEKIDYSVPQIIVESGSDGFHRVTICGSVANFAKIQAPEIDKDDNGDVKLNANGDPVLKWGVTNTLPANVKGLAELEALCIKILRDTFQGAGNLPFKLGDEEIADVRKKNRGLTDEEVEKKYGWKRGKVLIKTNTTKKPFIHNTVKSGDIIVVKGLLSVYPNPKSKSAATAKNKGISIYMDEIACVKRGEGFGGGGGPRQPTLDASQFAGPDSEPASASTSAPSADDAANPWET